MAELVDAIAAVYGVDAARLVRRAPDARIEALFGHFPPLTTTSARSAGFRSKPDIAALARAALSI